MHAIDIYQDVLDRLSAAAFAGDLAVISRHISLPFTFFTDGTSYVLGTPDALSAYCLSFTETLQMLGATDYIRIARVAHYVAAERIEGTHYSHMLRDGQHIVAPYASRMIIEDHQGTWQVTSAVHALTNDAFPIRLPDVAANCEHPPSRRLA